MCLGDVGTVEFSAASQMLHMLFVEFSKSENSLSFSVEKRGADTRAPD
jgi:hypothetical protein